MVTLNTVNIPLIGIWSLFILISVPDPVMRAGIRLREAKTACLIVYQWTAKTFSGLDNDDDGQCYNSMFANADRTNISWKVGDDIHEHD